MTVSIKSALLVIDVQKDFTQPSGRKPVSPRQAEQIIGNINTILFLAEINGLLPVYIGNEFRKYDPLNIFRNFAALEGSDGSKLDRRLQVRNSHYFSKQTGDALTNSSLVSFLRAAGIEHIYLTGLYAEACVFNTFQGAQKHGFTCSVVADAIASKTEARRQRMVKKFAGLGASIVSSADLVKCLGDLDS